MHDAESKSTRQAIYNPKYVGELRKECKPHKSYTRTGKGLNITNETRTKQSRTTGTKGTEQNI